MTADYGSSDAPIPDPAANAERTAADDDECEEIIDMDDYPPGGSTREESSSMSSQHASPQDHLNYEQSLPNTTVKSTPGETDYRLQQHAIHQHYFAIKSHFFVRADLIFLFSFW
ncbi:hypothetical protein R1sor_002315 [Riccia sorocarpa]|uniref:Uncharacterized protein n=1 Tax=Riccia sorocarpa TaxID=122646 RepID=A0ABD3GZA0_9MARC